MSYMDGLRAQITSVRNDDPNVLDPVITVSVMSPPDDRFIRAHEDLGRLVGVILVPETKEQMRKRMNPESGS